MTTEIFNYTIAMDRNITEHITIDNVQVYSFDGNVFYHKVFYNNDKTDIISNGFSNNEKHILLEILNNINITLWKHKYELIHQYHRYYIKCSVEMINEKIKEHLDKSIGLYLYIISKINTNYNINTDLKNISFIPKNNPCNPPNNFKVKLHLYQKKNLAKMLTIENKDYNFNINNNYYVKFGDEKILIDPIYCKLGESSLGFNVTTKGGILADEMGLGKTITCISLIASNPYITNNQYLKTTTIENVEETKIISKATLVVCPSHLLSQWKEEVTKACPHFKTLIISTKNDYKGLIFNDFIDCDIIITSYQFLMNFSYYPSLYYVSCTANSYNFDAKNNFTQTSLKSILENYKTLESLKMCELPIFEFFSFHRLILDETHEIFGNVLSNASHSRYLSNWVSTITADYNWYVSGTPFVNFEGLLNCSKYIKLLLKNKDNMYIDFSKKYKSNLPNHTYDSIIRMNCLWDTVLNNLCIRHRKKDVEDQINILGYQEKIIWVKFTDTEKQLYNTKKNSVGETELQQLCCHPLILESAKKIIGTLDEVDLDVIKSKMIEHHKNNLATYSKKITLLDKTKPEYSMVSANYNRIISESKFILNILEKIDDPSTMGEESCAICMDCLDNPTLTNCGHMFCYDCIKMCLNNVKKCPMCKQDLEGKELIKIISQKEEEVKKDITQENILIEKYGSKLGKLISIIRCITTRDDTRIIVFSQWDDMLRLVGKTLVDNGIGNSFVKGNVWSRTSAIKKFKNGDENKVIMLSLKNAASGTNLTEATHIFFVEPINSPRNESLAIEGQAIARACRIGQKQQVMILRVLVEDSIEQDIYSKYYDQDVVVANEEKDYFVNMPPVENDSNKEDINTSETNTKEKKKVIRKKKTDTTDTTDAKKKSVVRKKKTDIIDTNTDTTDTNTQTNTDTNTQTNTDTNTDTKNNSIDKNKKAIVINSDSDSDSDIATSSRAKPIIMKKYDSSDSDELEL